MRATYLSNPILLDVITLKYLVKDVYYESLHYVIFSDLLLIFLRSKYSHQRSDQLSQVYGSVTNNNGFWIG
jgi:hypothetical protein